MTEKLDAYDAQKIRIGTSVTRTLDRWTTLIRRSLPTYKEWCETFDIIADEELEKADAEREYI